LAVDQFHAAYKPYRHEPYSIYDLLIALKGLPSDQVCFLLSARPGYQDQLLGDTLIELPIAEYKKKEKYVEWLAQLGLAEESSKPDRLFPPEEVRFRRCLLYLLGASPKAMSIFDCCDALEALQEQKPTLFPSDLLFTPHVERAIWELRPLLRWQHTHQENKRLFSCFCQGFASWCQDELCPL